MRIDKEVEFDEYLKRLPYQPSGEALQRHKAEFDRKWPRLKKLIEDGHEVEEMWSQLNYKVLSYGKGMFSSTYSPEDLSTKDIKNIYYNMSKINLKVIENALGHYYSRVQNKAKDLYKIKTTIDDIVKERNKKLKRVRDLLKGWTQEAKAASSFDTLNKIRQEIYQERNNLGRLELPIFRELEPEFDRLCEVVEDNDNLANIAGKKWNSFKRDIGGFFGVKKAHSERVAILGKDKKKPKSKPKAKPKSKAKGERVQFEGRELALSTVRSYASKKDHPLNRKAVAFMKKHNKTRWTDQVVKSSEHLPTWGPALATPIQAAFGKAPKSIGKAMLDGTRDPRDSFSEGFNQAAQVDTKKISKSVKKAISAVFGNSVTKESQTKISEEITRGRQSAMSAIAEATKELAVGAKEVSEGLLWGTFNAGISGVGKVVGGSAFLVGNAIDNAMRVAAKINFEDALAQFYGNIGKDELLAVSQFIDEDGNFDADGYRAEMEKAVAEIKAQVQKYVKSVNQKQKAGKTASEQLHVASSLLQALRSELKSIKKDL